MACFLDVDLEVIVQNQGSITGFFRHSGNYTGHSQDSCLT